MEAKKLATLCRDLAENRKAENVVVLDVSKISSITDYFVIATGTSEPHLRAITGEITDKLRDDYGVRPRAVEGDARTPWQVLDFFDVIVHIMKPDMREKYDLETLWGDAPLVKKTTPRARRGTVKKAK